MSSWGESGQELNPYFRPSIMSEPGSIRQRRTSTLATNGVLFPAGRSSPIPRPTSFASVQSTNYSDTDHSEILSPTPRRHYLIQQQSSQWLQNPGGTSPPNSRPSSPLNPNNSQRTHRKHKPSLSFSSLVERHKHSKASGVNSSLARRWVRWMHRNGLQGWVFPCQILCTVWVKWAVGLGSYSGQSAPPMYGDYEAQRHWLEITYHLPVRQWYKYDLPYWGLDYPPLTAYVSWLCGFIASMVNPAWVALDSSRGIETSTSKIYMRLTVLVLDLLIYVPALLYFINTSPLLRFRSQRARQVAFLSLLTQPALLLIDSGHFQYNSVMLGLTLQAFNFFAEGRDLLGAVCFVASLGFKQMSLYYSPAIFAYLLGKCLILGWKSGTRHLLLIAFTTISAFILLFLPFLYPSFPEHLIPPIQRIFPFARGLFEDKVANFWCASNVIFKWKTHFSSALLPKFATGLTAVAFLPTMWALLAPAISGFGCLAADSGHENVNGSGRNRFPAPTFSLLGNALFQCSLSFFLFSFQVHEKSILVPLLPITVLMAASAPTVEGGDWEWGVLLNNVACFSMWPLLKRDGLGIQYSVLTLLWNYAIGNNPIRQTALKYLTNLVYSAMAILHLAELAYTPPTRYPDLFPVLNALLCAGVFGLAYLWSLRRLIELSWAMGSLKRPSGSGGSVSRMGLLPASPLEIAMHPSGIHTNGSSSKSRDRVASLSSSLRRRNPMARASIRGDILFEGHGDNMVDLSEPLGTDGKGAS